MSGRHASPDPVTIALGVARATAGAALLGLLGPQASERSHPYAGRPTVPTPVSAPDAASWDA